MEVFQHFPTKWHVRQEKYGAGYSHFLVPPKISSSFPLSFYQSFLTTIWNLFYLCSLRALQGAGGIPVTKKMCYAVGGVPYQITSVAMGISLQIFLLEVVQVGDFYLIFKWPDLLWLTNILK